MPNPIQPNSGQADSGNRTRQRWRGLLWLLLPSLIVGSCAVGSMIWRLPTKVEIDAIVTQAQFHSRGDDRQVVLQKVDVRSLALGGFKEVRLTPAAVWIFNPVKYDIRRNLYPEDGWSRVRLPSGEDLVLTSAGQSSDSAITIEPDKENTGSLGLGSILAGRGAVNLSAPEPGLLSLELRGGEQNGTMELPKKFLLLANSCTIAGVAWPYLGPSVTLRIQLSQNNHFLAYAAEPSGILFQTRFAKGEAVRLLDQSGLAIDRVEFVRAARLTPDPQTTLDGPGTVKFVGHQGVDPVSLQANDLLKLSDLREFRLLDAALTKDDKLRVRLSGIAGSLSSGPPGSVLDRRLTLFDVMWHNPRVAALFTILVWLVTTLIAGRKLLKEQQDGTKPS
jgi:hypothetical protein